MGGINAVLRYLFALVFVCSVMVWVIIPTSTYKNSWSPKLKMKLNTNSYLEQGVNLVLFTLPLMFIGAFGCVYLHLEKKFQNPGSKGEVAKKNNRLAFLKRPMLVMSPLGIVTAMELAFAVMFMALMVWSLANYLHVSFGHLHMHRAGEKVWMAKFRSVSLRLGYIGNTCVAFLFFPVTRGSSILPLVGLTSESSIKYHIWLGHLSMALFTAHTVGFVIYWAITDQMILLLEWDKAYVSNVAGLIAIVLGIAMWITSLPRIRRKLFELFFYTHHLYGLYILFYALHVGSAYLCMILPGIFLFVIDRYLRFLQSRQRARLVSARNLPCGVTELNFAKSTGLQYNPTSIMFLNIPSISKLQWHPFTISSNCNLEPDRLSVIIKTEGTWSQKLYQELSSANDRLEVSVEGPYGPNASHFLSHEMLVMVSGGSGITPFISIIREIIYQGSEKKCTVPKVLLVCTFKNYADLALLDLLLPLANSSEFSNLDIQIEAYVTREKDQPTDVNTPKHIQTIVFKPHPTDAPISAALGPNNWLWLCAIIISSFAMFLILLHIIARFYIYPIDKTGVSYHFSLRVLWDFFLMFSCVFAFSSAIFLWCKKQNGNEANQILNVDFVTPKSSPGSWLPGDERELESLPHHSLVQATSIHMGARPDLKSILFGRKEADVGVLVCGPRGMRHDVARICSSGLSKNLHFEAISFNW